MARLPLKHQTLWQISVTTSREAEEAVAALLERLFGQPASTYVPEDKDESVATVYSSWAAGQVRTKRDALREGLKLVADCQLAPGAAKILIRKVPRDDWTTSWKKYFKTIRIGSALIIKPSWSKLSARKGEAVVTLDPGLSFGTGQHATTSFCLKELVRTRKTGQPQSFLDIGTGSGILAIAAAKLGYRPVLAFDNDPMAVRVAKENARKNRVEHGIAIARQDLTKAPITTSVRYDLICANLVQDLLLAERDRLLNRLKPGGKLVLAGLLISQFGAVDRAYTDAGLEVQTVAAEGEWKSGSFLQPGG